MYNNTWHNDTIRQALYEDVHTERTRGALLLQPVGSNTLQLASLAPNVRLA